MVSERISTSYKNIKINLYLFLISLKNNEKEYLFCPLSLLTSLTWFLIFYNKLMNYSEHNLIKFSFPYEANSNIDLTDF